MFVLMASLHAFPTESHNYPEVLKDSDLTVARERPMQRGGEMSRVLQDLLQFALDRILSCLVHNLFETLVDFGVKTKLRRVSGHQKRHSISGGQLP